MKVLAALEPSQFPVISLYLSLSTNQNGREDYQRTVQKLPEDAAPGDVEVITSNPGGAGDEGQRKLSDELITRAQQTAARITFIEDASLLADVGGVGALLRFRI